MSRIGKTPIDIPSGVTVDINNDVVKIKGKNGEMTREILPGITVKLDENQIVIERSNDSREMKSKHGLIRSLLNNMVIGVSEGFQKELHIIGLGYSSEIIGPWLKLAMGYSHDTILEIPEGIVCETEDMPRAKGSRTAVQAKIRVKGFDKELVGKFAAEIRGVRPPDNYKGKGIRYSNEFVKIKAGKTGTK